MRHTSGLGLVNNLVPCCYNCKTLTMQILSCLLLAWFSNSKFFILKKICAIIIGNTSAKIYINRKFLVPIVEELFKGYEQMMKHWWSDLESLNYISWVFLEGEQKSKVDWHRIMISRTSMKSYATQYVQTGDRVLVKGKLQYRTVVNPDTGKVSDSVAYINTREYMWTSSSSAFLPQISRTDG